MTGRGLQHPPELQKLKFTVSGLPGTPSRFRDANDVHARLGHERHILLHTGFRHIFVIVCCAKINFFCLHERKASFCVDITYKVRYSDGAQ